MRAAIIEKGVVVNIAKAPAGHAAAQGWVEAPAGVSKGWFYDGKDFTAPDPEPAPVPASVSPLQIRKALREMGLKSAVDTYIASQPDEVGESWEYAVQVDRDNPDVIAAAASVLGKTEAEAETDIDDLFRLAATL